MSGPLDYVALPKLSGPALCREVDSGDLFFPEKGDSPRAAKRICANCEVRDECLTWAINHNEAWGIWGGLTALERRKLRRTMPRPAGPQPINHGTPGGAGTHYTRGEKPCDACREAVNRYAREKGRARRARGAA